MNRQLQSLINGSATRVEQGTVVTADRNTVTVSVGGRPRTLRRTALAVKPGDRLNIQGESIVGKRKPPPVGSTFEI